MTDESCINYCQNKGYIYAGTEFSSQCCRFSWNQAQTYQLTQVKGVVTPLLQVLHLLHSLSVRWDARETQLKLVVDQIALIYSGVERRDLKRIQDLDYGSLPVATREALRSPFLSSLMLYIVKVSRDVRFPMVLVFPEGQQI
jgi:hypothetical protein